ncbi:hypothetical protein MLPF_0011 [Mycobacterium lepromatosis]|nr:hypothetical protein MLPF_0011 [Mycobacterium lepromatosis]
MGLALMHKMVDVIRKLLVMAVTDNRLVMNPVDHIKLLSVRK